jgi:hypothetical protein
MAVDLQAATPDATFAWATALLFGADSQLAVTPSVFPASAVLTALLGQANTWAADQTINGAGLVISGNHAAPAWLTGGIRIKGIAGTLTDTTSAGTIAAAATNALGGNTIAASNVTVFTDYYSTLITAPIAGANVTLTNGWALGLMGALKASGQGLSGAQSQSLVDLATTWNTSGLPTAIKLNVVDTASNAASLFLDFQQSSVSRFSVTKDGSVTATTKFQIGTATNAGIGSNKLCLSNIGSLQWTANASAFTAADLLLARDAANTLAQRNGVNPQAFRIYGTYTDGSNFERAAINTGADYAEFAAETAGTGDDDLDVRLTPAGAGKVRFGTVTVNADAPVTGYVTIKDAAGNAVKLATIA